MPPTIRIDLADAFAAFGQGAYQASSATCRRFLVFEPAAGAAMHLLSLNAHQLGLPADAESRLRRVVGLVSGPDLADAFVNRAAALQALGRYEDALASIDAAMLTGLAGARAYTTRGAILRAAMRPVEALQASRQALAIAPAALDAWMALGNAHQLVGELPDANTAYLRAIAIAPANLDAHGNMIFTLSFMDGTGDKRLALAARAAGKVIEAAMPPRHLESRPRQRLRIGYVSSEFFARSALDDYFPPVLARHDKLRFETILISTSGRRDERTEQLRAQADGWFDLVGVDRAGMTAKVRDAQLDIAVCLTGYLPTQRALFADRLAPIQVSLFNYISPTGMLAFDCRITDEWLDPPGLTDHLNTERLVRLSAGYAPASIPAHAPDVSPLPAAINGYVTFGSFNNLAKLTPATLGLWARLLSRLPTSRLLVKARALDTEEAQARFRQTLANAGIDPAQLNFFGSIADEVEHLRAIGRADLALDPIPFSGGRTTVESLAMGVPVVNRRSSTIMGRVGASLLTRAGLPDLVTESDDAFIEKAVHLASNLGELAELRATMRERLARSVLYDVATFTRELEGAYKSMVRAHQ